MIRGKSGKGIVKAKRSSTRDKKTIVSTLAIVVWMGSILTRDIAIKEVTTVKYLVLYSRSRVDSGPYVAVLCALLDGGGQPGVRYNGKY